MPLHDHFRPPWSVQRPWEGFHSAWATAIAFHLNNSGVLPPEYFAFPLLQVAGHAGPKHVSPHEHDARRLDRARLDQLAAQRRNRRMNKTRPWRVQGQNN